MTDAVLEIDGISKRFGAVTALADVSVTAPAGELTGLGGARGAGRTTVLRIGAGVLAADSGRVRWRSAPIDPATRRRIGYLPASGGLYAELTVLDQLVHRAELHGFATNEAHQLAQRWLDRLGLRALRGQRTRSLGTDEFRLVALVATLLPGPEPLLLDDPFAGAGDDVVERMVDLVREHASIGVPVLLSGNDLDLIERHCNRAAVLRKGRLVASGTIGELVAAGPRLFRIDAPGWHNRVPGCRTVELDGSRMVLELDDDTDDQAVLTAALAEGPVYEFTRVRRSLAQLYDPVGPS